MIHAPHPNRDSLLASRSFIRDERFLSLGGVVSSYQRGTMAKRKLPGDRDTILSIAHQEHVTDEHNYPLVGSASRDRRIMLIFADFHFTLKNRGQSDLFTSAFWSKIKLDREFWAEVNVALGWNDYNDYKLVRKEGSDEPKREKKEKNELFGLTE